MPIESFDEYQKLESTIQDAFTALENLDPNSEDYATVVDQIVKLTKVRQSISDMTLTLFEATKKKEEIDKTLVLKELELNFKMSESEKPPRVSPDTWAMIAANLAGIVVIVGYERLHVIASKALGFVFKTR